MRQVTHALLTRPPLSRQGYQSEEINPGRFVRLACVKHAASVHPEPGSNSHVHILTEWQLAVIFPFFTVWSAFRHHSFFWNSLKELSGLFYCLIVNVHFLMLLISFVQLLNNSTSFDFCQHLFSFSQTFFNAWSGEGGIWTLAPLLTTYSLSRGAPSASWVLLQA